MSKFKVLLTDYAWGDLAIEREVLSQIDAELVVAEQHDEETLTSLAVDVDAIITCWATVPAAVIEASPNCRIVSRLGIGLDNIDVEYCTKRAIPVTNVPDYCVQEVAEHALALMLALARNVAFFHHETKEGRYDLQATRPPRRLQGQTLGIIGFGHIGRGLARLAEAIGLKVIVHSRTPPSDVEHLDLSTLLEKSDFVSLHASLTEQTHHLIGINELALMKPTAFLINTARGGLVDHAALAMALEQNQLAGAGLDVQTPEPPDLTQPPYNDPRVIVTPHTAFVSVESVEELRRRAATQVATRLCGGVPENVVNLEKLE
ncbi:MAG: dehydrogenase [Planctomycetaceae bacterium]|nr:dehydrogenase [Planctomycetaceae bacterium]